MPIVAAAAIGPVARRVWYVSIGALSAAGVASNRLLTKRSEEASKTSGRGESKLRIEE